MLTVNVFPNNPLQENTYIVYDETGKCAILDPGMMTSAEENAVAGFIRQKQLTPVMLLSTHCHIDHVLGNKFVFDMYGLRAQFHAGELDWLADAPARARVWGLRYEPAPLPETFLPESGSIALGDNALQLIFAPGHSPAHLCFYSEADRFLIGGDVLFYQSIGRTDLPGGDHAQLLENIRTKLFVLPDDCVVYPGHGPQTTIGHEKRFNPFLS